MPRALPFVIVWLAVASSPSQGQVCNGLAHATSGPFQAFGTFVTDKGVRTFGAGIGYGVVRPFGQIDITTTSFDNPDGTSLTFRGRGGYQLPLDRRRRVHVCPTVSFAFVSGPTDVDVSGDGSRVLDIRETVFQLGAGLGVIAARLGQTQIVPTASVGYVSFKAWVEDQVSGGSYTDGESYGLVELGVGVVLRHLITLRPSVAIPFSLDRPSSTAFHTRLGVSFGRPRQ